MGEMIATSSWDSPLGRLRVAVSTDGVLQIALPISAGAGFQGSLQRSAPDAESVEWLPLLDDVRRELEEYFAGSRKVFSVPLDLRGTPFQLGVWQALREIPYGLTCSYGDIARAVGRPQGYRAVGLANGANPIPILVPCHRVIATGGKIGGYSGGLETKKKLLAFEQGTAQTRQTRLL